MQKIQTGVSFDKAVEVAINMLPGLRHDFEYIHKRRMANKQARDMQGVGRIALHIPDPIEPILRAYHPQLFEGDRQSIERAWLKFIKHPDSKRFRLQAKL